MGTQSNDPMGREPTKDLVTGLLADVKDLAVGQLGRMQGEIKDELANLKSYMLKVAIAVGVVVVGAVLGGHTLATVLVALGVPVWLSYALVAVLATTAGILVMKRLPGDKTDVDLLPEETFAQLKQDLREVSHAGRH
jgi:uncharacterized membrane protein YqjE